MEYLKPIELLQASIKRYQIITFGLIAALCISIIAVPLLEKQGHCFIAENDQGLAQISETKPWELTTTRIEKFTKYYLSNRFEWNAENFKDKSELLKKITSSQVNLKLKDSLLGYETLIRNQSAKSVYTWEGFGFSNSKRSVEVHITRVLLIKNLGVATPLVIRFTYQESALTKENPFGIVIDSLQESEPVSEAKEGGSDAKN